MICNLAARAGTWRWSLDAEERLLDAFDALNRHPGLGHIREELLPRRVRVYNVPPYQVPYLPDTTPIRIIGIAHGAMDIATFLLARPDI